MVFVLMLVGLVLSKFRSPGLIGPTFISSKLNSEIPKLNSCEELCSGEVRMLGKKTRHDIVRVRIILATRPPTLTLKEMAKILRGGTHQNIVPRWRGKPSLHSEMKQHFQFVRIQRMEWNWRTYKGNCSGNSGRGIVKGFWSFRA